MNLSRYAIKIILATILFASPFIYAQTDFLWAKGFAQVSGASGFSTDYGHSVTTDSLGNILLTGEFQGTITFPSGLVITSQGNFDYFLVKFDKNGNALWKRTAGSGPGSNPERGWGVRYDRLGNIVTCGSFFVTTTWEGGGNPDVTLSAIGNLDGFIAKYDSSGKLLWVKPQTSVAQVVTYKIAIDKSNNIISCGYFGSGTVDTCQFDTITIKSNGGRDAFIAKFDQDGHVLWAKTAGGPTGSSSDQAQEVVVDSVGNVYVCGTCVGNANFSGLTLNCDTTDSWKNGLTQDAFVAKYSPSGDIIWAKNFGGHNADYAYGISLDGMGHLYVTGSFDSVAVFGSLGIINSNGKKGPEAYLLKMDTTGNPLWIRTGGGSGSVSGTPGECAYSVAIDKSGNPWMVGSFQGTGIFSGTQIISMGGEDLFIAEYSALGDLLFLKRAGGSDIDRTLSAWIDLDGNLLATGRYRANADFGTINIGPAWADDIFLYKLGSSLPVEMSSFVSNINGRNITLNWETKTELNSRQFEIQRSSFNSQGQSSSWINIGSVKAAGTSVSPNKYSFIEKDIPSGSYQYRLKMIDNDGSFEYSKIIEVKIGLPQSFDLSQNYPNPFNPSTTIKYQLPVDAKVILEVFNITGQKIAEVLNKDQSAGYYSVPFGLTAKMSSGVYIYRIIAIDKVTGNNFSSIKKMMLLK